MKNFLNYICTLLYWPIFLLYFRVVRSIYSSEYNMYCAKLKCPYGGFIGFVWIFRKFPEYRNLLYIRFKGFYVFILSILYSELSSLYIIPSGDDIGNDLMIWHGFSTIVNAQSIGSNCSIWQQVTIGNKLDDGESKPIIGDNVKICAGSIVIGNITIGDNSIIGAGSVVTKDVPSNCVVAGVPAKIIKMI